MEQLAELWSQESSHDFNDDPPTVGVVYGFSDGVPETLIAEMTDVRITDGRSGRGERLTATLEIVPEETRAALAEAGGDLAGHAGRSTTPGELSPADTKKVVVTVDPNPDSELCPDDSDEETPLLKLLKRVWCEWDDDPEEPADPDDPEDPEDPEDPADPDPDPGDGDQKPQSL